MVEFNLSLENVAMDNIQFLLKLCHHGPSIYIYRRHTKQGLVNNKTGVI